ncbi:hypothetical protein OIU85_014192, partial [Salix viminalis]
GSEQYAKQQKGPNLEPGSVPLALHIYSGRPDQSHSNADRVAALSRSISTLYYYPHMPVARFQLLWKQASGSSGGQRINDRSNYQHALSDGGDN